MCSRFDTLPARPALHLRRWTGPLAVAALAGCAAPAPRLPPPPPPRPAPTAPPPAQRPAPPAATPAPAQPPAPVPAPAEEARAQPPDALGAERDWLLSFFTGTPVLIEQRPDGLLLVDVPREFCFDAQRNAVKPPLAAVLNKLAESLRRTRARLAVVAAPDDDGEASPLALQRATQVRSYLIARGVLAAQLAMPTATSAAAVQLRMEPAPR